MTDFEMPDPNREQNPHQNYDRITTSVIPRARGWHVVIRKWHSVTGVERFEESKLFWPSEHQAEAVAVKIAEEMRKRIIETGGHE